VGEEEAEAEEEAMEAAEDEVTVVDGDEVMDLDVEEEMMGSEEEAMDSGVVEVMVEEAEEEEELHFEVAEAVRHRKFSREINHISLTSQRHALITSYTVLMAVFLHPTRSWQRPKTPFCPARELISARWV